MLLHLLIVTYRQGDDIREDTTSEGSQQATYRQYIGGHPRGHRCLPLPRTVGFEPTLLLVDYHLHRFSGQYSNLSMNKSPSQSVRPLRHVLSKHNNLINKYRLSHTVLVYILCKQSTDYSPYRLIRLAYPTRSKICYVQIVQGWCTSKLSFLLCCNWHT